MYTFGHVVVSCEDATATLNGDPFITIASGATTDIILQDQNSDPIVPDDVTGTTITVTVGSTPVGATLMKTGQTTSYRAGDDGDIEAGRATNFTTLATNNPFGNTNRFTDELGGQTYTNNIVIDWSTYDGSTVLGIYRAHLSVAYSNWNTAIDDCASLSVGGFSSGWRLWNYIEACNFMKFGSNYQYDYSPLNSGALNYAYWTSTTYNQNTGFAYCMGNIGNVAINDKTTVAGAKVAVRNFTVSGTTLS